MTSKARRCGLGFARGIWIFWIFAALLGTATLQAATPTATVLSAPSPNPQILGRPVTLTATVAPSQATGRIILYDGGSVLASQALSNGQAVFATAFLSAGKHSLRAFYTGDTTYSPSTSATATETITTVPADGFTTNSYSAGNAPSGIAQADFNGDGRLDLALVEFITQNVLVYLGNGDGTFQLAPGTNAVGNSPTSIAATDLNGDGKPDLVVTNYNGNSVSVLLGNGDGTFQAAKNFPTGTGPRSLVAADFNNDGKVDVAVSNAVDSTVSVLAGNGDGTFQTPVSASLPLAATQITTCDLNGDGKPDLVAVMNGISGNVAVLQGKGDGTFQSPQLYTSTQGAFAVLTADFDGDGNLDVAIGGNGAASPGGEVNIRLGNGDGTLQSAITYSLASSPTAFEVSDFDGDGKLDLAVSLVNNNIAFLLGSGGGTFTTGSTIGPYGSPYYTVAADYNGDGRADLAVANLNPGSNPSLDVLLGGPPKTTFISAAPGPSVYGQSVILTGSVSLSGATGSITFYDGAASLGTSPLSSGSATLTVSTLAPGTHSLTAAYSGDANHAAQTSKPLTQKVSQASTTIAFTSNMNPAGYDQQPLYLNITVNSTLATGKVRVYDGVTQIQSGSLSFGYVSVALPTFTIGVHTIKVVYNGDANFLGSTSAPLTQTITQATPVVTLDSSSNPAIVGATIQFRSAVSPSSASGSVSFKDGNTVLATVPLNAGSASMSISTLSVGTHNVTALYSGDANVWGGSSPSLSQVVRTAPTGTSQITLATSANPEVYGHVLTLTASVTPTSATGKVTFYDGVAVAGRVSANAGVARVPVLLTSGRHSLRAYYEGDDNYSGSMSPATLQSVTALPGAGFAPATTYATGMSPQTIAIGDFNRDGKLDMATTNGNALSISIFLGNGDGTFQSAITLACSRPPESIAVADFNGDGNPDFAVSLLPASGLIPGYLSVFLGNGDGTFKNGVNYMSGYSPQVVVTADFDGDGRPDLAISNAGGRDVAVLRGNGDGTFQAPLHFGLGASPSSLVVADFNNDGKPDLGIGYSTGSQSGAVMLGNGDGTFGPASGIGGYSYEYGPLVTADFDGDGNADLALTDHLSNVVRIFKGAGDGTFTGPLSAAVQYMGTGSATLPLGSAIGDFNGDGTPDLVVAGDNSPGNAGAYVLLGNGNGTFQSAITYAAGNYPYNAATGDFNGDGVTDFAIANYSGNTVSVFLGIPPLQTQTISFPGLPNGTFGSGPLALAATASSGLAVTFTSSTPAVCGVSGSVAAILSGGLCTITARQPGNARYTAATPVTQSFTVNPASQTITFSLPSSMPFTQSGIPLTGTASSGLPLTYVSNTPAVCTVTTNTLSLISTGTCSIVATQPGNSSNGTFSPATAVTQAVTISPISQTILFGALNGVNLGTAPFSLSATASSLLAVTFSSATTSVCTVAGGTVTIVAAGTCSIVAMQSGNATYSAASPVTQNFTVAGASQTISFSAPSAQTLGGTPPALSATASSGLTVAFSSNSLSVCTVSGTSVTLLTTGTCSITATQAGNANYSAATPVTQTFSVNAASTGGGTGGGGGGGVVGGTSGGGTPGGGALAAFPSTLSIDAAAAAAGVTQTFNLSFQTYTEGAPTWACNSTTNQGLGWLKPSPSAGTMTQASYQEFLYTYQAVVTVAVDPAGISAGSLYTGSVNCQAGGGIAQVPVTMNVTAKPAQFTALPQSLQFTYREGDANVPNAATVSVTSAPVGAAFSASVSSTSGNWVTLSATANSAPASLKISIAPQNLSPGTYNAVVSVTSNGAGVLTIPVALNVIAANAPAVPEGGVVPVYSSVTSVQSGSWISIYGSHLAPSTAVWHGEFPTTLGGVSVTVNKKPAYLWFVSPTQINLQAPDDTATGPVTVEINTPAGSTTASVTLAAASPSFSLLGDAAHVAGVIPTPDGSGAYSNGTYDLAGPSTAFSFSTRPVKPGETLVLFGVGFGPTSPPVSAGQVFSGQAPLVNPVRITIGGVEAPVLFAGITSAGLYQFNVIVPSVGSGDQPLQAILNGVKTQVGPTVTVQ